MSLTPSSSFSVPTVTPAGRPWRQFVLWGVFVLILGAGVALAVNYGREAPVLLEQVAP